ncbi:MAG: 2-C-methyl-D-erythritol 4-phosphate cytidylyltransferase, partial [Clostridia bacterium]|nr:2-C-methyl-D-erythritol 4-phosphate cytidylyltransferase [Clostridia bacterium]
VVTQSLIRDNLMSLQTPQGVSVKYFKESALINDLSKFTDDTSVVEAVGATTQVVEGSYRNIKITTPEDVQLAKLYLENMGE